MAKSKAVKKATTAVKEATKKASVTKVKAVKAVKDENGFRTNSKGSKIFKLLKDNRTKRGVSGKELVAIAIKEGTLAGFLAGIRKTTCKHKGDNPAGRSAVVKLTKEGEKPNRQTFYRLESYVAIGGKKWVNK